MSFFFFQAEDGIRDHCVTGVQTCALPISSTAPPKSAFGTQRAHARSLVAYGSSAARYLATSLGIWSACAMPRSEERRVGKESRSWWSPDDKNKRISRKK